MSVRVAAWAVLVRILLSPPLPAAGNVFTVDPARTRVNFTLGATLHTVHGSFQLKRGVVRFDPDRGQVSGELVVDARTGNTGNSGRDRKMHATVLESEKYPDIVFRPDRFEGALPPSGTATLQVHGTFSIHGMDHEMTIPVQVQRDAGTVTATLLFKVPYVRWGMKNPSTLFLRVPDQVDLEIQAVGRLSLPAASARQLDKARHS